MGVPPNRCTHCCIHSTFADIITYLYLLGPYLNQLWNEDIIVSTGILFYVWFKGGSLASSHPIQNFFESHVTKNRILAAINKPPKIGVKMRYENIRLCSGRGGKYCMEKVWQGEGRKKSQILKLQCKKNLHMWRESLGWGPGGNAHMFWVTYTQYLISIKLKTCLNTCKYTLGRANYKKLETSCLRDLPIASPSKLRNKRPPKTETIIIKPAAGQAFLTWSLAECWWKYPRKLRLQIQKDWDSE